MTTLNKILMVIMNFIYLSLRWVMGVHMVKPIKASYTSCKIYDLAYSGIMWTLFYQRWPDNLFEDNVACVAQIKEWYIKGDKIKHISPSLLLSLTPKEWWNRYLMNKIKWQFSRFVHKCVTFDHIEKFKVWLWNTKIESSTIWNVEEIIIIFTWGGEW